MQVKITLVIQKKKPAQFNNLENKYFEKCFKIHFLPFIHREMCNNVQSIHKLVLHKKYAQKNIVTHNTLLFRDSDSSSSRLVQLKLIKHQTTDIQRLLFRDQTF